GEWGGGGGRAVSGQPGGGGAPDAADSARRGELRTADRLRQRRQSAVDAIDRATERDGAAASARREPVVTCATVIDRRGVARAPWRWDGIVARRVGLGCDEGVAATKLDPTQRRDWLRLVRARLYAQRGCDNRRDLCARSGVASGARGCQSSAQGRRRPWRRRRGARAHAERAGCGGGRACAHATGRRGLTGSHLRQSAPG